MKISVDIDKMAYFVIMTIILSLLAVLGFYIDRKKAPKIRRNVEELYINGIITIGTVTAVSADVPGNIPILGTVFYRFERSNDIIFTHLGTAQPKQISDETDKLFRSRIPKINKNDKFLVLYHANEPRNAILLLDHPINSDVDFERYKAEIEELRKDQKWRGFR